MAERVTYTEEQRAEACALYIQIGPSAASKALGIPAGTICSWANRTGLQAVASKQALERWQNMTEHGHARWEARRAHLLEQFGGIAEVATETTLDLLEEGNVRAAKDAVTVAAIATDKAQLLSGGATSRIEAVDANTAILGDIERLLEERRSVATSPIQVASHSQT